MSTHLAALRRLPCLAFLPGVCAGADPAPRAELALAAAADFTAVYPTRAFLTTASEMSAVWRLNDGEDPQTLTSVWIAVDVGDAAAPNQEIARHDQPVGGQKRGKFRYRQPGALPAGKYRLDILADGKPWESLPFTVVLPEEPAVKGPLDIFPLTEGKTTSYDFVFEPGSGASASLPGLKPDASGTLRAKVTLTVGKREPPGVRIEMRRNGELVIEEWWRVDGKGLSACQRRGADGSITKLDPHQVLFSFPLSGHQAWAHEAKDGSFRQSAEQWGPFPMTGPGGRGQGYVVLVEQGGPREKTTAERHFVVGSGLVREVIISAVGGSRVSRQEITLAAGDAPPPAKEAASPAVPTGQAGATGAAPTFEKDFKAALERARKEEKPLLCEFYMTRCPHCKRMEATVYGEPEVADFSARHVWVRLDQEKGEGKRLVQELQGGATPTYMAIAQDGKTVYYRFSDAVGKEGFLHNLSLISVPRDEYLQAARNPEARLPTAAETLILAKAALMKGDLAEGRRMLEEVAARDPANASGLVDDALLLLGSIENASWTDEGAKKAREIWTRVLKDYPESDRAPDAVFYLAGLLEEVGPRNAAQELEALLKEYPRGVDIGRARKIAAGE